MDQLQISSNVQKAIEEINRMVQAIDFSKSNPPFYESTLTFWRRTKFQQATLDLSHDQKKQIALMFINQIDNKSLQNFHKKVDDQIFRYLKRQKIQSTKKLFELSFFFNQELINQYIKLCGKLLSQRQLINDFINRPYCPLSQNYRLTVPKFREGKSETVKQIIGSKIKGKFYGFLQSYGTNLVSKLGLFTALVGGSIGAFIGGYLVSKSLGTVAKVYNDYNLINEIKESIPEIQKLCRDQDAIYVKANQILTDLYNKDSDQSWEDKYRKCYDSLLNVLGQLVREENDGLTITDSYMVVSEVGDWMVMQMREPVFENVGNGWMKVDFSDE